ncbi:hypothetical protein [Haloarcula salinisoli]|uniref:Uncharacterized protein n=1 Tax=Haloarcula salinisoli TaxID=2487746 RepID=A0A8J7YQJ1_9EURY|nr:hypothetical protein [Halomicroarcula salinisoli]MBX0306036.1 hypothetical protein [Halomicroarcula salinisoli]
MKINILDNRSESYFENQFGTLGLLAITHVQTPIEELLNEYAIQFTEYDTVSIDGQILDIYYISNFDSSGKIEQFLSSQPASSSEATGCGDDASTQDLYFLDLGHRSLSGSDGSGTYLYYVFNTPPDRVAIRSVQDLLELQHEFRFGELAPVYKCTDCSETVHWLSVCNGTETDDILLSNIESLVRNKRCGCTES